MGGKRMLVVFLAVGTSLMVAQSASAATFSATCNTLQAYLDNTNTVNNGDVVQLTGLCVDKSFTITNTNAFTLEGVGNAGDGTPSSGFNGNLSNNDPILSATAAVKLTIKNLLFENGGTFYGGTGIRIHADGEAVTIENDVFTGLTAGGGSLYVGYGGAIDIESASDGAGVSTPTVIAHNTFSGDGASDGGALYWEDGSPLQLTDNTFTGNTAFGNGGTNYPVGGAADIENYEGPPWLGNPVTITGNTFGGSGAGQGNKAPAWGGGLYVAVQGGEGASDPAQTVTLDSNKFIDNQITGLVITGSSTTAPVTGQDLVGAGVAFNPQIREFGFKVAQSHNVFQGNTITGAVPTGYVAGGAGEWGTAVSMASTGDVFTGNQVDVAGTATPAPEGGALGIIGIDQAIGTAVSTTPLHSSFTGADDLFLGNSISTADGWGGAIYTGGSTGIYCVSTCPSSSLTLYDSTLSGNAVPSDSGEGAAIWGGPADSLTLDNTIVYGNRGVAGASEIFGYAAPSYRYDDLCTTAGGTTVVSGAGNLCADPKLAANGAETASSPTIDKGSNALVPAGLTTDVAGDPRISCPNGIVDMGAFELPLVGCGVITGKPACTIDLLRGRYTPARKRGKHKLKAVLPTVGFACTQSGTVRLMGVITEKIPGKKGKHGRRGKSHFKRVKLAAVTVSYVSETVVLTIREIPIKLPKAALKALETGVKETLSATVTISDANGTGTASKTVKLTAPKARVKHKRKHKA